MSLRRMNAYILLNGTAGKAIELYQKALGAKAEAVMKYGDVPGMQTVPPEQRDYVMHAMLKIGNDALMLSDTPPDRPAGSAGNVEIALDYTDLAEMQQAFEAMSAGGKVSVPIQDMFWGAKWGSLTDAYGVRWMFNCDTKKG
jgi:PhnB protein